MKRHLGQGFCNTSIVTMFQKCYMKGKDIKCAPLFSIFLALSFFLGASACILILADPSKSLWLSLCRGPFPEVHCSQLLQHAHKRIAARSRPFTPSLTSFVRLSCSWYSTEGSGKDQLSGNSWFNKSQALAGDKNFIKKEGS